MTDSRTDSITPAVVPVCSRCDATGGYIRRRPHSTAELTRSGNPMLCGKCNREVSR